MIRWGVILETKVSFWKFKILGGKKQILEKFSEWWKISVIQLLDELNVIKFGWKLRILGPWWNFQLQTNTLYQFFKKKPAIFSRKYFSHIFPIPSHEFCLGFGFGRNSKLGFGRSLIWNLQRDLRHSLMGSYWELVTLRSCLKLELVDKWY